ncbi:cbb3-type cytochrome oxidase assembly protein CcoS [Devosia algicola]|uniref:Cbb3-type cytochrome oxidase assembly protein CcoS n=1 Tax=Devosia algicola TaxID=3026418 RepID=A0ABY7YNG0_9HYPH|nr:cbb3-type cytochrome oxidase assembly protein CcoS [Devosia algicola]WDR02855.1 cbb3-type cytochrome oxidase assembly protein CcoS [Devosia algicola]
MSSLYFLIPISILSGAAALAIFFWSLRNGQYEDLDGAAERILDEDDDPLPDRSRHGE